MIYLMDRQKRVSPVVGSHVMLGREQNPVPVGEPGGQHQRNDTMTGS